MGVAPAVSVPVAEQAPGPQAAALVPAPADFRGLVALFEERGDPHPEGSVDRGLGAHLREIGRVRDHHRRLGLDRHGLTANEREARVRRLGGDLQVIGPRRRLTPGCRTGPGSTP